MAIKKPDWVKMKPEELEKIVIDLAQKNIHPSKIGLILRDTHGIPSAKIFGKKISQIIKESSSSINSSASLKKKVENLEKHLSLNKQDKKAKKAFIASSWELNTIE